MWAIGCNVAATVTGVIVLITVIVLVVIFVNAASIDNYPYY